MAKDQNQNKNQSQQEEAGGEKEPVFISLSPDDLVRIIREARIDPKAEAKEKAEAERLMVRRSQMVALAKRDMEARANRQRICGHRKPDGQESSAQQEYSDGIIRVMCLRCQKILRTHWNPAVYQGMAIQAKMQALGITEDELQELLTKRADGTEPPPPPDDFALGMPRSVSPAVVTTETGHH